MTVHLRSIHLAIELAGDQKNIPEWVMMACTYLKRDLVHKVVVFKLRHEVDSCVGDVEILDNLNCDQAQGLQNWRIVCDCIIHFTDARHS